MELSLRPEPIIYINIHYIIKNIVLLEKDETKTELKPQPPSRASFRGQGMGKDAGAAARQAGEVRRWIRMAAQACTSETEEEEEEEEEEDFF